MTIERVAIEAHLGVKHQQLTVGGFDQRVDFQHLAIEFHEGCVKLLGQLLALLVQIAAQFERESHGAAMMRHEALRRVDGDGGDQFGRVMRHIFDIHAAFGRCDHRDLPAGTVHEHGEIIFFLDIDAVGDIEAVDLLAFVTGLDRDQRVAEHFLGRSFDFLDALGQTHAAFRVRA